MKKYSREKYDPMLEAEHQQLFELQYKTGVIKCKKTPENSRALEDRVLHMKIKQIIVAMRTYLEMKSPELTTEIIQPLTKRKVEPDRAM